MTRNASLFALFALFATIAGCGGSRKTTSTPPASSAPAATTPAPTTSRANSSVSLSADPSGLLAFNTNSLSANAGKVTITFTNSAPLAHNLTIASSGGGVLAATPTFSGGSRTLSVTLKAGTYTFYCSVPGHRQAGMQGTLTVQ